MRAETAADWRVRWRHFVSELVGTALLVFGGLSIVILMSGEGSPMVRLVPNALLRTILTAFLFGTIGGGIALSWVGRESGAHINPAVTMAFWLVRKLDMRAAAGYIVAQLLGAGTVERAAGAARQPRHLLEGGTGDRVAALVEQEGRHALQGQLAGQMAAAVEILLEGVADEHQRAHRPLAGL